MKIIVFYLIVSSSLFACRLHDHEFEVHMRECTGEMQTIVSHLLATALFASNILLEINLCQHKWQRNVAERDLPR